MKRLLLPVLAALVLAGCQVFSGTRIDSVTSQKPEAATMRKVLVLGVNTTPEVQRAMEEAFSRRLQAPGRDVVLASSWFPGEKQPGRDVVKARALAEGVTGVLVTRLLDYEEAPVEEKTRDFTLFTPPRVPGARVGWAEDPWVAGAAGSGQQHGDDAVVERRAIVETRLYDTATGEVMWEAQSRTLLQRDAARNFDGFVSAIVTQLRKNGWL